VDGPVERRLDRVDAVGEDVVEKEQEDAGGQRAQTRLQPDVGVPHPAEGQAEEDREAGYGTEQQNLTRRQTLPFRRCKVHLT
jgi:hypothetical protein